MADAIDIANLEPSTFTLPVCRFTKTVYATPMAEKTVTLHEDGRLEMKGFDSSDEALRSMMEYFGRGFKGSV